MAKLDHRDVARVLREIGTLLQIKGENQFKTRAYENAAQRLQELPADDFDALLAQDKLTDLPGIGEAISKKVKTLVETGSLPLHDQLRAEFPPGIFDIMRVPDLGPKRIAILWKELKIPGLAELEQACRDQKIRTLKGFGEKTENKILEGIELLRRTRARRPLGDVRQVSVEIADRIRRSPGVVQAEVAGSVRRYRETVADVDIIVAAPDANPPFDAFVAHPAVERVIARGDTKCSVILRDGLQVDVRVVPEASWATALHHFTGSKDHHIKLRGLAQERGLKISEWSIERTDTGEKLPIACEADLYAALGMAFVPPEMREGTGEVEAALEGRLPVLVEAKDLKGFVHVHSKWSDGENSILELAEAARALGASYLTITDHSRSAGYAGGLNEDRLKAQWEEIAQVQEQVPEVRLLKGSEVDILDDGRLDYPDAILEQFDVVVASVHSKLKMTEEEATQRILAALDNPFLHVLGHPTGRLIGKREGYPLHIEKVLEKAAAKGVAVELNGNPERLDLCAEHVRMAQKRGVKMVLTTDAHSVVCLGHVEYAVATARRGWLRREDVLNALPVEEFLKSIRRG